MQLVERYLKSDFIEVDVGSIFPKKPSDFDLIVPINYPKVVNLDEDSRNVVVFHTSDLPRGRGWSPIANIFLEKKTEYCLSAFTASPKVDSGDVLIKMRFNIRPNDTARSVRQIDNHLTFIGILLLIKMLEHDELRGEAQEEEEATYSSRRNKEMNKLSLMNTLGEVMPLLRSAEPEHELYVEIEGIKFEIYAKPIESPTFPEEVEVDFLYRRESYLLKDLIAKFDLEIELPYKL
jgi:methionyl-tRNA formyltransferase